MRLFERVGKLVFTSVISMISRKKSLFERCARKCKNS